MKIKRISNVLLLVLAMIMSVWGTYATKVDADGSGALNPWVYTWKNLEKLRLQSKVKHTLKQDFMSIPSENLR